LPFSYFSSLDFGDRLKLPIGGTFIMGFLLLSSFSYFSPSSFSFFSPFRFMF